MIKLLYFICQLVIGWIERCNHAYKDESVSVNATDETQPIQIHDPTKEKRCDACRGTGKMIGERIHDDIIFYNDCPACGGSGYIKMDDTQPVKVRWTAEQIKPERYPENKPTVCTNPIWMTDPRYGWTDIYFGNCGYSVFGDNEADKIERWFIDIPGAPEELKPLKYPENKPDGFGPYWAHLRQDNKGKFQDRWIRMEWWETRWGCDIDKYSRIIDYFIPYRLEE